MVEVLITTMNGKEEILDKMNIQTNAMVGDQTTFNEIRNFEHKNNNIKWISMAEKGVGLNRNNLLLRTNADIVVIADDDMVFKENYAQTIIDLFRYLKDADFLIFNLEEKDTKRRVNKKIKKINMFNYMNYGAARFVFKTKPVLYRGISFNTKFGGGTPHSCGEDTLFLRDCLKAKMKVYAVPDSIAFLKNERDSSWFQGYDEKYFIDKGILLKLTNPFLCNYIALYLLLKHKEYYQGDMNFKTAYKAIKKGFKFLKNG